MSEITTKLDAAPLVERLTAKSKAGKLDWEPSADRKQFITSVSDRISFRIRLETITDVNEYGQLEDVEVPRLDMLDEDGHLLWEVYQRDVPAGKLRELYNVARRIGNQLDTRVAGVIDALDGL
jgi:hypothetical protein